MFSDKKAWGYAIVLLAMAIGGAALLMKIITWEQFKDVGAIATVLLALTATLRSTAAATEARVVKAVGLGTGDGSIPAKPEGDSK